MALKDDGTVWVWGYYGYSSGPDNKNVTVPEKVAGLENIKAISAGNWHYLVVDKEGYVWAWGNNINGQLGINNYKAQSTPVKVSGISGARDVAAGYQFSLILKNDGTVWASGWNNQGVLGTGSGSKMPVQVPVLSGITAVAASTETAAALKDDGTIYIWGNYYPSAMALGVSGPPINTPTALTALPRSKAFSADFKTPVLALSQNGTVWGIGGLSYKDPETDYPAESGKAMQIKFIESASTAAPTATVTATTGTATTGKQTPSTPLLLAIGVFSLAVAIRAGKK
jgi:alpha-tubulin suppressor-like RCC1 family protein